MLSHQGGASGKGALGAPGREAEITNSPAWSNLPNLPGMVGAFGSPLGAVAVLWGLRAQWRPDRVTGWRGGLEVGPSPRDPAATLVSRGCSTTHQTACSTLVFLASVWCRSSHPKGFGSPGLCVWTAGVHGPQTAKRQVCIHCSSVLERGLLPPSEAHLQEGLRPMRRPNLRAPWPAAHQPVHVGV